MSTQKHIWTTFFKRRIKIRACANCGEMNLPSNDGNFCEPKSLTDSQIMKAGYQLSRTSALA
jgi:hypothetical protein